MRGWWSGVGRNILEVFINDKEIGKPKSLVVGGELRRGRDAPLSYIIGRKA